MPEAKTKENSASVSKFIANIDHEQKRADGKAVLAMFKKITGLKPKMWGSSIIGFGSYHYKYESGHEGDAALIAFSPRKTKLVLYVLNNFAKQDELLAKLGKYKTGKICLYINKLADVDLKILEKIVVASWKHSQRLIK